MNGEQSADAILKDFVEGQRKGRIVNFIITIVSPLCVLAIMCFGFISFSNQYSSAKEQMRSEIEAREARLADQQKEIQRLTNDVKNSESERIILASKLNENEAKYKKLVNEYKSLKRDYIKLKKAKGFRTYAYYRGSAKNQASKKVYLSKNHN